MFDKLKCPFCGAELQTHTMTPGRTWICVNKRCVVDSVLMKREVWQALVDGKAAQDALKKARELHKIVVLSYCEMAHNYDTMYGPFLKTPEQEAEEYMKEYDEQIALITKTESKNDR